MFLDRPTELDDCSDLLTIDDDGGFVLPETPEAAEDERAVDDALLLGALLGGASATSFDLGVPADPTIVVDGATLP